MKTCNDYGWARDVGPAHVSGLEHMRPLSSIPLFPGTQTGPPLELPSVPFTTPPTIKKIKIHALNRKVVHVCDSLGSVSIP